MRLPRRAGGQLGQPSALAGFVVQSGGRRLQGVGIWGHAIHIGEQVVGNRRVLGQRSGRVGRRGAYALAGQDGPDVQPKQGPSQNAQGEALVKQPDDRTHQRLFAGIERQLAWQDGAQQQSGLAA